MFNTTTTLVDRFVQELQDGYKLNYGDLNSDYASIIGWSGQMALEYIANSNALYHTVEHTLLVTLVGQEILRGKHIREGGVSCSDWMHFMIALLCHDIGYVKGVCRADRENQYATGIGDGVIPLSPGATDASLAPYHINRGKRFVSERFGDNGLINAEILKRNIETTQFPIPAQDAVQEPHAPYSFPGLIRAADLIGLLSDPRYLNKTTALYYEFEEIGFNRRMGYTTPEDVRRHYAAFHWNQIAPYIQDALMYLSVTQAGKQILASVYSNVFVGEHETLTEDWSMN
jgi:hypothetical protein